jgi:hypothetical protein
MTGNIPSSKEGGAAPANKWNATLDSTWAGEVKHLLRQAF